MRFSVLSPVAYFHLSNAYNRLAIFSGPFNVEVVLKGKP